MNIKYTNLKAFFDLLFMLCYTQTKNKKDIKYYEFSKFYDSQLLKQHLV